MPTLRYSGHRLVDSSNVTTALPTLVENVAEQINENKTITVEELRLTPGAGGGVDVTIAIGITGSYGELGTLESTLATAIADRGFEPDADTAMDALELQ